MYAAHIFTEVEQDDPIIGENISGILDGYDLTDKKIENIYELAGGDLLTIEKEPEEEPRGYIFKMVSNTANYANIAARILEYFGEGMTDKSYVFAASEIALNLKQNKIYSFPLCNTFIDLLVASIKYGNAGLNVKEISKWIDGYVCNKAYGLYDDNSRIDVRYGWNDIANIYDFYVEKYGKQGAKGTVMLASEIARCVK